MKIVPALAPSLASSLTHVAFFPWTRRLPKVKSGHSEEIAAGKAPRNAALTAREGRAGRWNSVSGRLICQRMLLMEMQRTDDVELAQDMQGPRDFASSQDMDRTPEGSDTALVAAPSLDLCTEYMDPLNKRGCRNQHRRKRRSGNAGRLVRAHAWHHR